MSDKINKGSQPISYLLKDVLKPVSKNFSTSLHLVKQNWKDIIGDEYYKYCKPEKVSRARKKEEVGTLTIAVYNTAISMYISGNELYIIDKVNSYFGKKMIDKIRLKHDPKIISDVNIQLFEKKLSKEDELEVDNSVANVKDDELKDSLSSLGKELFLRDDE